VNATEILRTLPASLEWMVFFRLSAIRSLATDAQMKAMFFLPEELELESFSHVILSSRGRCLAPAAGSSFYTLNGDHLQPGAPPQAESDDRSLRVAAKNQDCRAVPPSGISKRDSGRQTSSRPEVSFYDRYPDLLSVFPPDEADCLGVGRKAELPPVLLHLVIDDGYGQAKAIFHRKPSEVHYELLQAVGVEYEGGYAQEGSFVALFRNQLSTHIHAGSLAGYSRTGNCNQFFLNHGEIDRNLEAGLIQASEARTAWARDTGLAAAETLARKASEACLAMTCQPPPPQKPFSYGDLVPLGFLLKALTQTSGGAGAEAAAQLQGRLLAGKQGLLWPFHTGRLVTATDSVLILQGLLDRESIEALEQFSDGCGGYYPQLWSETKEPGRMVIDEANAHWRQPDFATTCLVRGLRAEAGLPTVTPLRYLEDHFETRSGLYFANPYLTDWALAAAIQGDADAGEMKRQLQREILAGINDDCSFGTFDPALSTSFAILALAALGCRGRVLRLAQLRLVEIMDTRSGLWPECVPFYSTFMLSGTPSPVPRRPEKAPAVHSFASLRTGSLPQAGEGQILRARGEGQAASPQVFNINGYRHELSLYFDTYRVIATAVAVLALSEPCVPERRDIDLRNPETAHPRYRCRSHAEYVARFALPPYMEEHQSRSLVIQ
jgi:hypothetical protein